MLFSINLFIFQSLKTYKEVLVRFSTATVLWILGISAAQCLELSICMTQCLGGLGWSREFLEGLKAWPFLFCLSWLSNSGYLGMLGNLR